VIYNKEADKNPFIVAPKNIYCQ